MLGLSADNNHIGNINPFRYRNYYYDKETKLYYLNSRYYNPEWGRFINPDSIINANKDLLSYNLYIYCSNNPIANIDTTGFGLIKFIRKTVKKVVKKVVQKVTNFVQKISSMSSSNKKRTTKPKTSKKSTNNLPDYTKALDRTLVKNTSQSLQVSKNLTGNGTLNYFYRQSHETGEWNYRVATNWDRDMNVPFLGTDGEFLYHGKVITAEDFGNLNYGFVGAAMGFDPTVLFMGGGYAKCGITVKI